MAKRVRRPVRSAGAPLRAVLYCRVSTQEQARTGYGLDVQREALVAEAHRRGWHVVAVLSDEGVSGSKHLHKRPAGDEALRMLSAGEADVLASSKLDRTCRSFGDAGNLLEQAQREGWQVCWADLGLDTSTPAGQLMAGIMASTAQYEREMCSVRTRDSMAAARAGGVKLGRPSKLREERPDVVDRIVALRHEGRSLPAIAKQLEHDGVLTATGKARWYPSTVASYLPIEQAAALV